MYAGFLKSMLMWRTTKANSGASFLGLLEQGAMAPISRR
jgi:hypothetical protein